MKIKHFALTALTVCVYTAGYAVEPNNYYKNCENKGGAALLTALQQTVGDHTVVSYDGLWTVYNTSDVKPNGKIWDMYSTKEWTPGQQKCGNYSKVGDCYNREHSLPKSWFNEAAPMKSDAFHIYPTDGKVNGQRGDNPYGECAYGTTLASNGSIKALGKLGTSTFSGYSGTVFEPDDEYKGDFARSYFYMAAAYNDKIAHWSSPMLGGTSYPAFSGWAVELLLKWHRQDPVSEKEINRNEAVYAYQKNRNPFIDHPEMVEYIWGDKKTEAWTMAAAAQPTLSVPVNGSTINLGTVAVGVARQFAVTVNGSALKNNLNVSVTDANNIFTVSPSTLAPSAVNSTAGTTVTVTVNAKAQGTAKATLSFKSTADNINTQVTLTVEAMTGLPATAATSVTDESFVANWTYVGGADSNGCYKLYVLDADGNNIANYPRSVTAADEHYLVEDLDADTDYSYYVTNNTLTSNKISVRTAEPIPSVQILYDGELELNTAPEVASEAAELLLDIENIYTDITFSVSSPFQLSSDKGFWDTSLTVDPREDRIYIRLYGNQEGTFTSTIKVVAGDYVNDNAEVTGTISSGVTFIEDFDLPNSQTGNYTTTSYTGNACKWTLKDAGVYNVKNEAYSPENYMRFGKTNESSATMAEDKDGGIGTVTLYAAGWSSSDGSSKFKVEYSTDGGATWTLAGDADIAAPSSTTKSYSPYNFTVNQTGKVRLRIVQTYGQRMCIDNISATNYFGNSSESPVVFGDDSGHGWDAYCHDGRLTVETAEAATVAVYGMDGVTYVATSIAAGTTSFGMAPGLYVVSLGNSTRRVLVK